MAPMVPMAPGGGSAPNLLAMVPRQVNPSVTLAPFLPPPPMMTRVFAAPPLPPGFIRSPPGDTQSSESTSSYQQPPRLTYTPPTPPAGPSTPTNFQLTSGAQAGQGRGQGQVTAMPRQEVGFDSPSKSGSGSGGGVDIRAVMKRQPEVERLGIPFTSAQYQTMWELSDLRRHPPKNEAAEAAQRQRLITYSSLLVPIREKYGDMQAENAKKAVSLVFGMHMDSIPPL
ncbi:hypothetical protein T492DRAFT_835424 [Pavlovales sp. CCMP2436]|nr:hypothetical protein T492DRAFT_835424 [Pavlovales sp. CCMP2436]